MSSQIPLTLARRKNIRLRCLAAFFAILGLSSSQAATWDWNVTSGQWNTGANWDPATVPNPTSTADFINLTNGTGGTPATTTLSSGNVQVYNLSIGADNTLVVDDRNSYINFNGGGTFSNTGVLEFSDSGAGITNTTGLFLNSAGSQTNTGTIQTTAGTFSLREADLSNAGGLVSGTTGGIMALRGNSTITGGTLRSDSGGTLDMGGYRVAKATVNLDGVTVDNQSVFRNRQNAVDRTFGTYDTITNLNSGTVFTNQSGATTYVLNEATGGTNNLESQDAFLNLNTGATFNNDGTLLIQANGSVNSGNPPSGLLSLGAHFTVASDATAFTNTGTVSVENLSALAASNATFESAQSITNAGTVEVIGNVNDTGASFTVTGGNSYIQTAGSTLLQNGGILTADLIDFQAGSLGGDGGVVDGATTVASGASLAPGNSIGSLTFNDDLTLNGTYFVEMDSTNLSDSIEVLGSLDISNAILDLSELAGGVGLGEGIFTIATYNALVGTFDSVVNSTAYAYNIDYAGGGGNDIVVTLGVIPEPGTFALVVGLGAFGLMVLRRRR